MANLKTSPPDDLSSQTLLRWYQRRRRDLPWRRRSDPYAIWVSEIMLQQTRVETALPYFHRFLERFPGLDELAAAKIEEVLALWSGLGYYRRARLMHQAAQKIVTECGGEFPSTLEGLRALPGIGEYTAAAVGSIAFGLVEPSLDGNVKRVLGRLLALEVPVEQATGRIRDTARLLLDPDRPGDSNQALMEIGATLCTPRRPKCDRCPLEPNCQAASSGDPTLFPPAKNPATAKVSQRMVIAVARREDRYLMFRRPEESELLAGLWEFPWVELGEEDPNVVETTLADGYGGMWSLGKKLGSIRHAITYRSFEIDIREARIDADDGIAEGAESAWLREKEILARPHGSIARKVFATLATTDQGGA